MVTNFFQQQQLAKTRTKQLVFLYGCAVVLIVMAVYLVVHGLWYASVAPASIPAQMNESLGLKVSKPGYMPTLFEPWLFFRVALISGGIIFLGTIYKILALGQGGPAVAQALGGRLIDLETKNICERKGLNVVEEMAIASGLTVPPVYILDDESGINAFAAGFGTSDAVIGLTRGCLEKLSRDELQGVIGHEFSHILNGDMRLNLKLIGVLHGILLIALIGETCMRLAGRSSSNNKRGPGPLLFIGGLGLFIIGYIGVFFGRLIKSAVSRQREYLADASSVQFTRNPRGLSGALKKILGFPEGSDLKTPKAEQASHMFISNCLSRRLVNIFATHPPLIDRIQRIDPSFRANIEMVKAELAAEKEDLLESGVLTPQSLAEHLALETPQTLLESIGQPGLASLAAAAAVIERLDSTVRSAAQNELGARALVLGMLIA